MTDIYAAVLSLGLLTWLALGLRKPCFRLFAAVLIRTGVAYATWRGRIREIRREGVHDGVYLTRYALFGWLPGDKHRHPWLPNIYLHHIQLADPVDLHNHPWHVAASLILRGYYVETRAKYSNWITEKDAENYVKTHWRDIQRNPGEINVLRAGNDYHRIRSVPPGGCWTLFVTSGRHGEGWGFAVPGEGFVRYQDYNSRPVPAKGA